MSAAAVAAAISENQIFSYLPSNFVLVDVEDVDDVDDDVGEVQDS